MSLDQVVNSVRNQHNNKPSILIVDDSRVVRVSLKNILQENYEVIEADTGEKAWEILLDQPVIRLVFSDLSMPKMDGIELLRKLRLCNDKKISNTPFIVITGKEENQEIRSQLLEEGANDLVTKPFDSTNIAELARSYTAQNSSSTHKSPSEDEENLDGISNKVVFSQSARKELSFAIRNKNELALLVLKLDHFEIITKHYSDPAIEHILITTAEIIRSQTRIEDLTAYFGEGTFAILLPASNSVGTKYLGRRILSDLQAKKFYLGESDSTVTASIGISAPEIKPGITFGNLLNIADQRLQAAINAGGNRVVDKGNASVTPVSTLLFNSPETDPQDREINKQTDISMRKLAEQEVQNIKESTGHVENGTLYDADISNLNDALLIAEHENRLLKEEIFKLQKQQEDSEILKKQLYETDAMQQQTRLILQQLRSDFEAMRVRAETAESNQNQLLETDTDRSIIEEHLLEESEQIHDQLTQAYQKIEKTQQAFQAAEIELSNLKQELKQQKEIFEIELADEHMMRSIAEKKLADLEEITVHSGQEAQSIALTAAPTIAPVGKTTECAINTVSNQPPVPSTPQGATLKKPTEPKRITTRTKDPGKRRRSWPFKILISTICILLGLVSIKIWDGYSPKITNTQTDNSQLNLTARTTTQDISTNDPVYNPSEEIETSNLILRSGQSTGNSSRESNSLESPQQEEAKLQAELNIRQMAEDEFLLLSNDRLYGISETKAAH